MFTICKVGALHPFSFKIAARTDSGSDDAVRIAPAPLQVLTAGEGAGPEATVASPGLVSEMIGVVDRHWVRAKSLPPFTAENARLTIDLFMRHRWRQAGD